MSSFRKSKRKSIILNLILLKAFACFFPEVILKFSAVATDTLSAVTEEKPEVGLSSCENKEGPSEELDPERFSKLKLNVKELLGSRWAVDRKDVIKVFHSIDITDATLVHDNQLTLRVEFNLRQHWDAPGLTFPPGLFKDDDPPGTFVSSDDKVLDHMWSPASYISTARESNMNTEGTSLSLVYIFKNTTIVFKVRMFTKVGCTSSFEWYPLDVQSCTLAIESYKYHDDIVSYHWTDTKLYRPVVHKIRRLFQYDLIKPLNYSHGTVERGGRGKRFAFVRVKFVFERKLGNNLIQVYTPTILVITLSWFSFWLGLDAIPGRISLLVTCMLTLVTMHSGIKSSIPPVHYITMMDVWMVFCMAMVFSAMCEFVLIKYVDWRHQQKQKAAEKLKEMENRDALINFIQQIQVQVFGDNLVACGRKEEAIERISRMAWTKLENGVNPIITNHKTGTKEEKSEEGKKCDNVVLVMPNEEDTKTTNNLGHGENKYSAPWWMGVDKACRGLFPFLFMLFNVIYWPVLFNNGVEIIDETPYYNG